MIVQVFHNVARDEHGRSTAMMDGYTDGDPVVHVATMAVADGAPEVMAEDVYFITNMGDPNSDSRAEVYRAARNRSLSVGDVVTFDGGAGMAVDGWGFKAVSLDPKQVVSVAQHGTTPLGGQPYVRPARVSA